MKKNDGYTDRLKQAALEGVISRLEGEQAFMVVSFMKKCAVPEVVYESKKVRKLALEYIRDGLGHMFLFDDKNYQMAAQQAKAVRVPDGLINNLILEYFYNYVVVHGYLPRDFDIVTQAFAVPKEIIAKKPEFEKAVLKEIGSRAFNSRDVLRSMLCYLKYFSLSQEAMGSMVKYAFEHYAFRVVKDKAFEEENEALLDKIISDTKLNRGEILALILSKISELIEGGFIEEATVLIKKFKITPSMVVNENNKKLAVDGALKMFRCGEIKEAKQIIRMFDLSKADFEESELLKAVGARLGYDEFNKILRVIAFADLPQETVASYLRDNLKKFVREGVKNVKPLAEKYGIGWGELVKAAEDAFVEGLASSGNNYVMKYVAEYGLSQEFLASERVIEAAKMGLIAVYKHADIHNSIGFLESTFGLNK
ncbi:MAG TPA: hypothetical protein PLI45_00225 [Candidatus Woesebacteria bacterium]|nr:hypothetical protein [Candidatus Woesebacteria bacterium]